MSCMEFSIYMPFTLSDSKGVDFFPRTGSPSLRNSREHINLNFVSTSVTISVRGSPIREFSGPGIDVIKSTPLHTASDFVIWSLSISYSKTSWWHGLTEIADWGCCWHKLEQTEINRLQVLIRTINIMLIGKHQSIFNEYFASAWQYHLS